MLASAQDVAAYWDRRAAGYDDQSTDVASVYWRHTATNVVLTRAELHPKDRLLDLGCGTGNVLHTAAPHVAFAKGVDLSPSMVALARAKAPTVPATVGDLREVDATGFAVVTACFALAQLTDAERTALWHRLIAQTEPGATLVIGDWMWTVPPDQVEAPGWYDPAWVQPYAAGPLLQELEATGAYRVVLEPLHPLIAVLTATRI